MKTATQTRRRAVTAYTGRASYRVPTVKHEHDFQNPMAVKGNRIRWGCLYCPKIDINWYPMDDELMREAFWGKGVVMGKPVDLNASWTVDDEGFTPDEKPQSPWIDKDEADYYESRGDDIVPDDSPYVAPMEDGRSTDGFAGDETPLSPADRIRNSLSTMTKPEILEAYPDYGMFKSWTKDKMIETVIEKELADE